MTFLYRTLLVGLFCIPAIAGAQSRTAVAIAAGASVPLGSFRDTQSSGTDFNIGLIRGSDGTPIGLRLDAAYDRLKGKSFNGVAQSTKTTSSGTANLLYSFSGYSFKPYILAGVGGFKMTSKPFVSESKIRFGFDFGFGITMPIGGKAAFVEARVNSITQPNAKPLRFVPIVLGFLF